MQIKKIIIIDPVEGHIIKIANVLSDNFSRNKIAAYLIEFTVFGLKQAWACLFAGILILLIIVTAFIYPENALLARYDFLLISAVLIQVAMLVFRLESLNEAKVILLYHIVGTIMEIFKVHMGSWSYPEDSLIRIAGVPLFSGFMYASVGSYLARIWRIQDMSFTDYPPLWQTYIFAFAAYINFFTHHFFWDMRWLLFGILLLIFGRTKVHFSVFRYRLWMPLVPGFILVALFIWLAENISSFSRIWLYPNQIDGWSMVSFGKLGSWLLLMIISFVLVTLINKPRRSRYGRGPH